MKPVLATILIASTAMISSVGYADKSAISYISKKDIEQRRQPTQITTSGSMKVQLRVLLLSRIAVSESGWDSPQDHAAIHRVILDGMRRPRGKRWTYTQAAQWKSKVATGYIKWDSLDDRRKKQMVRQRWIQNLKPSCNEPTGRDEAVEASWSKHRQKCLAIFAFSQLLIEGKAAPQVDCHPHHWGGDVDLARVKNGRMGLIEIDCGDTLNHFYRYPTRAEKRKQKRKRYVRDKRGRKVRLR